MVIIAYYNSNNDDDCANNINNSDDCDSNNNNNNFDDYNNNNCENDSDNIQNNLGVICCGILVIFLFKLTLVIIKIVLFSSSFLSIILLNKCYSFLIWVLNFNFSCIFLFSFYFLDFFYFFP